MEPPPSTKGSIRPWSDQQGSELQHAVDRVFGKAGDRLQVLRFSLTIADPLLERCPLIGCSSGFTELTGYEMGEIVGRNCRFLVDPVPVEMISDKVRFWAREFCECCRTGRDFRIPEQELEEWMPHQRSCTDGLFCAQMNRRKDGKLFSNMFYLQKVELDDRPYIIGLQTELPSAVLTGPGVSENIDTLRLCHEACKVLDDNMGVVERMLASMFWYTGPMRRQDVLDPNDDFVLLHDDMQVTPLVEDDAVGSDLTLSPSAEKCGPHGEDAVNQRGDSALDSILECCRRPLTRSESVDEDSKTIQQQVDHDGAACN